MTVFFHFGFCADKTNRMLVVNYLNLKVVR